MKKKNKFETIKNYFNKFKEFIKNDIGKISIILLIIVFILLGFSMNWVCSSKDGFSCSGNYTPPDPNDVKKIIKVSGKIGVKNDIY